MAQNNSSELTTRAALYRKYNISEATLQALEERKLLNLGWHNKNGLMVCVIDDEADLVLSCAALYPPALKEILGVQLPFARFLLLRLGQMPLEDIVSELKNRNIWRTEVATIKRFLKAIRDAAPSFLKPLFTKQEPVKEEDEKKFKVYLQVTDLTLAYEMPELIDALSFLGSLETKNLIDAALHTKGTTYQQAAGFLRDYLDITITPEALAFYQGMFLDVRGMTRDDVKAWYAGIAPSARAEISAALGRPLSTYVAQAGFDDDLTEGTVVNIALNKVCEHLVQKALTSNEITADFNNAIKAFNLLVDRKDRLRNVDIAETPTLYGSFRLTMEEPSPGIIRFPVESEEKHA